MNIVAIIAKYCPEMSVNKAFSLAAAIEAELKPQSPVDIELPETTLMEWLNGYVTSIGQTSYYVRQNRILCIKEMRKAFRIPSGQTIRLLAAREAVDRFVAGYK